MKPLSLFWYMGLLKVYLLYDFLFLHHHPIIKKISNLQNEALFLVETFLTHNSGTKVFLDKYFLQNPSQE